jgi:RHS repeat-associated protein
VTYQYNSNGWLTAILDGGTNVIVSYTYDAAGHRIGRTLANSTFTVYNYDNAGQVTNIWDQQISGSITNTISRFQYGYDAAGNRLWVKRADGTGDAYSYDAINQLTNVLYGGTNSVTYNYDAAQNRISVAATNSGTTTYGVNNLNQYTNVGGAILAYDGNGNLTNAGTWSYTYDSENRLIRAVKGSTNIVYIYDVLGRLIERDATATTNRFYYAGQQTIEERDGNNAVVRKYVYGPGLDEPVRMSSGGTNYYYHADAATSITEITDNTGSKLEQYSYDVYGNVTILSALNAQLSTSAIGNRLMFQGRDRDPDTSLYNFRSRYYSPGLGRFMQPDPIRQLGGLNLYTFAGNSPVNYIDPCGMSWWSVAGSFVAGVAIGVAIAAVVAVAAPVVATVAVSALVAAGVSAATAGAVVTVGGLALGVAGAATYGYNTYNAYNTASQTGNWNQFAFDLGIGVGGLAYAGYSAYSGWSWESDMANSYQPYFNPDLSFFQNLVNEFGTMPTDEAADLLSSLFGMGLGSLLGLLFNC